MRLGAFAALGAALALAAPATAAAEPGRIAVGLVPGASPDEVAATVADATGGDVVASLAALRALVVAVPDVDAAVAAASSLPGVEYAEPAGGTRALAFEVDDPLATQQWYLESIRAFTFWPGVEPPPLAPVLVAVVDSGIDWRHPEFHERIEDGRSFVSSSWKTDRVGHGTMVAGEIAAALNNAEGIAGVSFSTKLLVAKVSGAGGTIAVEDEARAIRWAVDKGADVVNLSLGGLRDPRAPEFDTYSELERAAIDYATRKGVVVVAAVGNCDPFSQRLPSCPYPYASYPAALQHVVGVSAFAPTNRVPSFSNRDAVFNDLAAPGKEILSTLPRALTDPDCGHEGYSLCARDLAGVREYRRGEGTSFSAPLASAAAAILVAQARQLGIRVHASQVTALLQRSAVDIGLRGRDRHSGYGRLHVARAVRRLLERPLPPRDRFEANDDAGARAYTLWGRRRVVEATLDRYDDARDVFRVYLPRGRRAVFTLRGPRSSDVNLTLWKPGTRRIESTPRTRRAAVSAGRYAFERIVYRAPRRGWYFLAARVRKGAVVPYTLAIAKD